MTTDFDPTDPAAAVAVYLRTALDNLDDLTTDQFERGGDRPARAALVCALVIAGGITIDEASEYRRELREAGLFGESAVAEMLGETPPPAPKMVLHLLTDPVRWSVTCSACVMSDPPIPQCEHFGTWDKVTDAADFATYHFAGHVDLPDLCECCGEPLTDCECLGPKPGDGWTVDAAAATAAVFADGEVGTLPLRDYDSPATEIMQWWDQADGAGAIKHADGLRVIVQPCDEADDCGVFVMVTGAEGACYFTSGWLDLGDLLPYLVGDESGWDRTDADMVGATVYAIAEAANALLAPARRMWPL